MMGYTPVFGGQVKFVLLGSKEIGSETLLRWYVLHVLLLAVRDRHLHGRPLLARPQGRRHLRTAVEPRRRAMTEIPEHLLQRSAERRKALGLPAAKAATARPARRAEAATPAEAARPRPPRRRRARRRRRDHRGRGGDPRAPARALAAAQGRARGGGDGGAAAPAAPAARRPRPPRRRPRAPHRRHRPGRSHAAPAHRRQVGLDPADARRGPGQGPHVAAPARGRVRADPRR